MVFSIDEIYSMMSWDNDISVQLRGIEEAKKIKSLWVFILPILENNSKSIWENCANVLASKTNNELQPYYVELLEWLKDMNWPGADVIFNRLSTISYDEIKLPLEICLSSSKKSNDTVWEKSLISFESYIKTSQSYQSDN